MFIDEKRSGEPRHPSLAGFTAFVETKNPAEEYDWPDRNACACAQYAHSVGKFEEWLQPLTDEDYWVWTQLDRLARGYYITFGTLAKGLKARGV